jgi:WD40 repeat protein
MSVVEPKTSAVSPESPWLGLRPFSEDVREYFFGRDAEVRDLFQRVVHKPLTVLFGRSGLGKTSLLQAALVPRLRDAGFLPIVLRLDYADSAQPLLRQFVNALTATLAPALPDLHVSLSRLPLDAALPWLLFHDPELGLTTPESPRAVVLLDQFEEIFTLGQATSERQKATVEFLEMLADLVENRVPESLRVRLETDDALADRLDYATRPAKILVSLREDFLHLLERHRGRMPAIMDNRFELRLLTGAQALEAVTEPGRLRCRPGTELAPLVSDATGGAIVRFVAGVAPDIPLAEIDAVPPLLSLLCAELNQKRLAVGESVIRPEQLEGRAEDILGQFYERCFAPQPAAVRAFVEDRLLSATGFRESTTLDTATHELVLAGLTRAAAVEAITRLVDARLLTSEERGGVRRIELTHDILTSVARRSRDARIEHEAAARRRRQRARLFRFFFGFALLVTGIAVPLAVWALRERKGAIRQEKNAVAAKNDAERQKQAAEAAKAEAEKQKQDAVAANRNLQAKNHELEQQTQLTTARQLAAQAQVGTVRTPLNLLFALESISITQKIGAFSPTASRELLDDLLNATGGIPLRHAAPVKAIGFSPDDRWLAAASAEVVELWDMQAPSTAPVTLSVQNEVVNALAFSPDGRTLAIVGDDTGVHLWDMAAADRAASARVLETHSAHLVDVAFSRNGRWLATASRDGTAQLWDLAAADPATANSILPHDTGVNTLAFSPDNRWLATGTSFGTVRMWNLLSPNPSTGSIPLHVNPDVRKVAFSPNSQWLAAGDTESYTVVLMRVAAPDQRFLLKVNQWALALAFSPDGRWLATPSQYDARLWDLNKPDPSSEPLILPGHKNAILDLAFSPDGKWFATGSADYTVQLWNAADRFTAPTVLRGHEGPISALAFSHDSRHLATASADRTVRLWNTSSPAAEPLMLRTPDGATELRMWDIRTVDSPEPPRVLGDKLEPGSGSVFSPDGQWIATIRAGGVDFVDLWKQSTPSPTHYRIQHPGGIWAPPVFSPDGRWLATGGVSDPTVRLWNLKSPNPQNDPQPLRGHRHPVRSLAFSADGRRLVSGARDGFALIWDLATDPPSRIRQLPGGDIKAVAISADGRYVVTGSWETAYDARVWDLSSPTSSSNPVKLTFAGRVFDVAISPDGRWVAAGSWDSTTQLLDLSKPGTKPFVLKGHTARTLSVAFSPDSQWLATGNEDQTARLWNLAAADPSLDSTVLQAAYKVGSVSFSPDGRWLALNLTEYRTNPFSPDGRWFVSSNTNTRLYHVRLEDLIVLACRTAGRNLTKTEWELSFGDQPYRKTCPQLP